MTQQEIIEMYQKLDDKFLNTTAKKYPSGFEALDSGSGSASGSESFDPCALGDGTPVDASEACNKLAKIEGNGTYTQQNANRYTAAAGRYQFISSTAESVLKEMEFAKNDAEARAIWESCRTSSSPNCKRIQDAMCNHYSESLISQLKAKGIPVTTRNLYLAWNQGAGGASIILKAAANGENVTDPTVASHMTNQAWIKTTNARAFLRGMEGYMKTRGIEP